MGQQKSVSVSLPFFLSGQEYLDAMYRSSNHPDYERVTENADQAGSDEPALMWTDLVERGITLSLTLIYQYPFPETFEI